MSNSTKQIIRNAFHEIFENPDSDIDSIGKYFSKDYIQHVDGKTLNFEAFIKHIQTLKSKVKNVHIEFLELIADGNKACSVHIASAQKKEGHLVEAKVIAFFELKDGKIVLVDELTHLIVGESSDKEIGSC